MWDCHINHYSGLWWSDLVDLGHAQHYEALGWDAGAWENGDPKPDSDDMYWDELSPGEQSAAGRLCYSKHLWDQDPLNEWTAVDTVPLIAAATAQITSLSPTRSPTPRPTTPEPTSSEPTLEPSSAEPTTSEPTSSQPTAAPVTPAPTTGAPVASAVWPERALPPYPASRYVSNSE